MSRRLVRAAVTVILAAFLVTSMAVSGAFASTTGRRNTAIALTAGAVYAAIRHKTPIAIGLGAGAAYAWKRHADERANVAYKRGHAAGKRASHYRGSRARSYSSSRRYARAR